MPRSLARGRIAGEPAGPLFVHPGEIAGVGQQEGRAHGLLQRTPRRVQDRGNIPQTLGGLFLDGMADDGTAAWVKRALPGHEDQAAGLHGLAVGSQALWGIGGLDNDLCWTCPHHRSGFWEEILSHLPREKLDFGHEKIT